MEVTLSCEERDSRVRKVGSKLGWAMQGQLGRVLSVYGAGDVDGHA